MRVCLLTHHPQQFTQERFLAEARERALELTVLRPTDVCWSWPNNLRPFDLTLNRLSAVESTPYEVSLSALACWGRQVNPWQLRQELWDKSRQVIWLAARGLSAPPTFIFKGPVDRDHPQWREFVQTYDGGLGWVLKLNRGQRGVGVNFLANEEALFGWLETLYRIGDQDFLIQPRLSNTHEYRLTLLSGRPWAVLKRSGSRANFAQGGSAQEMALKDCPPGISNIAESLGDLGPGTYLSIDLLDTDLGVRILDVNTAPGVEQLEAVTGRNFVGELLQQALKSL